MKKRSSVVAFAAILMSGTFGLAWGGTLTDADGNVWESSGATITAVTIEKTEMTIPSEIDGAAITAFNVDVFKGNARAVRVTIPATVTTIPAQAFQGCANLKEVTVLGEGLTSIGKNAFQDCPNLAAFTIPNSVTTLGQGVFSGCSALEEVTIGDGVTTLTGVEYGDGYNGTYRDYTDSTELWGNHANALFYNCTSLKTINWGAGLKTIGNIVFLGCTVLEEVDIPNTVTEIGNHAFLGCSALMRVKIGKDVKKVGRMAFRHLTNLTNVTFGESVESIGVMAFQDCVNLKNFTLPAKIRTLNYRCFAGCNKALTEVTIPTNSDELETVLGQGVFAGCTKIETVTFGDTLKTLTGVDYDDGYNGTYRDYTDSTELWGNHANALFYNCTSLKTINWGADIRTIGNIAFLGCTALEEVDIPDTVTSLGNHAFLWCSNLQKVTIGNKVPVVSRMAFRGLANLTDVTFGSSVTEIGQQAFQDCVNLHNFTLPAKIQYLRYRCFADCNKALTEVTIPTNADDLETVLGQGVFSGCTKLETVTFGDTLKTLTGVDYADGYNGTYRDYTDSTELWGSYGNALFYNCTSLKTVNWGADVREIGNIAFLGCTALEEVDIPDTVTSLGNHAFLWCSNLQKVTIGNKVPSIGRMAFRGLSNLTDVTFGLSVTEIGQQAFQDCVNLHNFTLPAKIQYLRYRCFADCNKALTEVTIPTNADDLETVLGQGVFSGCTKLETVTFGDTLKTLTGVDYADGYNGTYRDYTDSTELWGNYGNALFYNCTSLKTINWGADIRTIGNIAFLGCTALEEVDIPNTVTSLGSHAFLWCSNLQKVTIGNNVPVVGRMAFRGLSNLTDVMFGSSVTTIGQQTFQDCVNLHNFTLPSKIQYLQFRCFAGCNKALTEVTIPTNADDLETVLGQGVFADCTKLETVTFGDTLKKLTGVDYDDGYNGTYRDYTDSTELWGSHANALFYNCTSLKTINWGKGIQRIGDIAFLNCKALTSVAIPNSVSSIGNHAFYGCSGLRSVVVGGAIDFIGRRAFGNCASLHWVDFRGDAMAAAPGTDIFGFDRDRLRIYAAKGSTGWGGIAGEGGLPASGTWSGVPIAYAPPPDGSDAPYDFYYPELTDTISRKMYAWPFPVLLTTNAYVSGKTVPTTLTEFVEGSPVYLTYAVNDYWHSEAVPALKNHFRLTGARSGGFDLELSSESATYDYLLCENAMPDMLQTLEPGEYTLTCTLNNDNALSETDYSNNVTSFTFTVTENPNPVAKRYTITYEGLADAENANPKTYTTNDLPFALTGLVREGYDFLGWTLDGAPVTTIAKGTARNLTLTATWQAHVYEVTYDANGGEGEDVTAEASYDDELEIAANAFTRRGYAFVGWVDADGNVYLPGTAVKNLTAEKNGKVRLYAEWEAIVYTLVYAAGGGSGEPYATNLVYGVEHVVEANWFVKEGATFQGWTDATGAVYQPGDVVSNLTDVAEEIVTFTAKWRDDEATAEQSLSVSGQGWHEVSFNVLPAGGLPETVFAPVEDKIGYVTYGSRNWNPATGGNLMELEFGKGYWLQTTADDVAWTVSGVTDPTVAIELKAGWNLIGYPLAEEGAVEDVLATALATGNIRFIYSGSRVYPGTLETLAPGKGYWVYAEAAATIRFDAK